MSRLLPIVEQHSTNVIFHSPLEVFSLYGRVAEGYIEQDITSKSILRACYGYVHSKDIDDGIGYIVLAPKLYNRLANRGHVSIRKPCSSIDITEEDGGVLMVLCSGCVQQRLVWVSASGNELTKVLDLSIADAREQLELVMERVQSLNENTIYLKSNGNLIHDGDMYTLLDECISVAQGAAKKRLQDVKDGRKVCPITLNEIPNENDNCLLLTCCQNVVEQGVEVCPLCRYKRPKTICLSKGNNKSFLRLVADTLPHIPNDWQIMLLFGQQEVDYLPFIGNMHRIYWAQDIFDYDNKHNPNHRWVIFTDSRFKKYVCSQPIGVEQIYIIS